MASPQTEQGFTQIANELYEAILKFGATGNEKTIIFAVMRLTYGYRKKHSDISVRSIAELINKDVGNVSRWINSLIKNNVLDVKTEATFSSPRTFGLNKDYESWTPTVVETTTPTVVETTTPTVVETTTPTVVETTTPTVVETTTPTVVETTTYKESIKEIKESKIKGVVYFENLVTAKIGSVKDFLETWIQWINYHHLRGSPINRITAESQLSRMRTMESAVDAMKYTIEMNYVGLREPDKSWYQENKKENNAVNLRDAVK